MSILATHVLTSKTSCYLKVHSVGPHPVLNGHPRIVFDKKRKQTLPCYFVHHAHFQRNNHTAKKKATAPWGMRVVTLVT